MLGTLVYIAIFVILVALSIKRPAISLVAVLCMFALEQWGMLYISLLRLNPTFTNIAILLLVGISVLLSKEKFLPGNSIVDIRIRALSILLLSYAFLSILWSPASGHAMSLWSNKWPYLVASILLTPLTIRNTSDMLVAQKYFIYIGGALLFLLATIPEWGRRTLIIEGSDESLALPLTLAQMSGYCFIASAIHFQKKFLSFLWFAVVLTASLLVAIKSGSRGPLIFMILTTILVAPIVWKQFSIARAMQIAFIGGFLSSVAYLIFKQAAMNSGRWAISSMFEDFGNRVSASFELLSHWSSSVFSILFGIGNSGSFSSKIIGTYPHMVPFEILGEEGIIGFTMYLMITYYVIKITSVLVKNTSSITDRKILATNLGFWIFTMALSLKQGSLLTSPEIFLFAALQERLFAIIRRNKKNEHLIRIGALECTRFSPGDMRDTSNLSRSSL